MFSTDIHDNESSGSKADSSDMEVELVEPQTTQDTKNNLLTQKMQVDQKKKPATIYIKKEMVDEIMTDDIWQSDKKTSGEETMDNDSSSHISMDDSDSCEKSVESEASRRMKWNTSLCNLSPVTKRKATTEQSTMMHKKLHVTEEKITANDYERKQHIQPSDSGKEQLSTDEIKDGKNTPTQDESNLHMTTTPASANRNASNSKLDSMNTDETSDTDIDWEKVAADMDKLEESKGPKITHKQAKFKL